MECDLNGALSYLAFIANTCYHHRRLRWLKPFGKFNCRHSYIIQANGFITIIADKMHMVIVVMACFAFVFA